jgi:hypothetical protein
MARKKKAATHRKQPGQQKLDPKKKQKEEEVGSTIETTASTANPPSPNKLFHTFEAESNNSRNTRVFHHAVTTCGTPEGEPLTLKQQIYKQKKDVKMEALQIIRPCKEKARNVDIRKSFDSELPWHPMAATIPMSLPTKHPPFCWQDDTYGCGRQ